MFSSFVLISELPSAFLAFLQMVLKTVAVLKLAFPFIAARENGNNRVLPPRELGKAEH
jgi:hypothetical protein